MKQILLLFTTFLLLAHTIRADEVSRYDENSKVYYITKDGRHGLRNADKKLIIPCEYDEIYACQTNQHFYVTLHNNGISQVGVYSIAGQCVVPCKFTKVYVRGKFLDVETDDGSKGRYTLDGKVMLEPIYSFILGGVNDKYFRCILGGVKNNNDRFIGGKFNVVDDKGNVLVPEVYDFIDCNNNSPVFVVNKGGRMKQNADSYTAGEVVGGQWGYYANGHEIIPCQYDKAALFDEFGVAKVIKDGEVSIIENPLKGALVTITAAESPKKSSGRKRGAAVSRYPAPDSDVDKTIPVSKSKTGNTFVFIIANENYDTAPVPYALNDGRMFAEYANKALGIPEQNINIYEDATFGTIITAVEKMKETAVAYDGDASVLFYYAGHGFPDDKQQSAYLLPIDGSASDITVTGYPLSKLYDEISALPLKSPIVFLDACFSGAVREDKMLAESRGVSIKVKDDTPKGNMVVFSASQGDETAHQLEDKHHGLFTYYLLKGIQQCDGGSVELGSLSEYVTKQVKRNSVVKNNKRQTPSVIPSSSMIQSWKTMNL